MRLRIIGLEGDGPTVEGDRSFKIPMILQDRTEVVVRLGEMGVELDRLVMWPIFRYGPRNKSNVGCRRWLAARRLAVLA